MTSSLDQVVLVILSEVLHARLLFDVWSWIKYSFFLFFFQLKKKTLKWHEYNVNCQAVMIKVAVMMQLIKIVNIESKKLINLAQINYSIIIDCFYNLIKINYFFECFRLKWWNYYFWNAKYIIVSEYAKECLELIKKKTRRMITTINQRAQTIWIKKQKKNIILSDQILIRDSPAWKWQNPLTPKFQNIIYLIHIYVG